VAWYEEVGDEGDEAKAGRLSRSVSERWPEGVCDEWFAIPNMLLENRYPSFGGSGVRISPPPPRFPGRRLRRPGEAGLWRRLTPLAAPRKSEDHVSAYSGCVIDEEGGRFAGYPSLRARNRASCSFVR